MDKRCNRRLSEGGDCVLWVLYIYALLSFLSYFVFLLLEWYLNIMWYLSNCNECRGFIWNQLSALLAYSLLISGVHMCVAVSMTECLNGKLISNTCYFWFWWFLFNGAFRQRRSLATECSLIWSYWGPCKNNYLYLDKYTNFRSEHFLYWKKRLKINSRSLVMTLGESKSTYFVGGWTTIIVIIKHWTIAQRNE